MRINGKKGGCSQVDARSALLITELFRTADSLMMTLLDKIVELQQAMGREPDSEEAIIDC